MRIVGPSTLTVGSVNTTPDPAQQGGNPSLACQIQNGSPYQLNVLAAGDVLSIQPFTAQTVEVSGQPIQTTPLAASGQSGACIVTFVFLLGAPANTGVQLADGTWVETPPQQDGPLTAAAITAAITGALSTQGLVDGLYISSISLTAGTPTPIVLTALHTYTSVVVDVEAPSIPAGTAVTVFVSGEGVFTSLTQVLSGSGLCFILPAAIPAGAGFLVEITANATTTAAVSVQGSGTQLTQQVYAPPGNPLATYQVGGALLKQAIIAASSNGVVLAAPPAGMVYRLHRLRSNSASAMSLFGSTTGFQYAICPTLATPDNLFGQLVNEGLTATNSAAAVQSAYLTYDLIPAPTLQ